MGDAPSKRPATGDGAAPAEAGVQGFTPLQTGTRIGELVVQSVLGAGEFGITYLTEHQKRSKRYVLKEYFPRAIATRQGGAVRPRPDHAAAFAWGLERFLSEARALQKIGHDSLVSLLGVTEMGGTAYIGMAYEQGREFNIWLHEMKRIAPEAELDKVVVPLLAALETAHNAKVYHFDLNPDGIVIRENGSPVIVDFGVFRAGMRRRVPAHLTKHSAYVAPELIAPKGGPLGPWTDIYSLAGIFYLAVTGKPPPTVEERVSGVALESAETAAKGAYRRELLRAIDAGLCLDPAARPRDVGAWRQSMLPVARFGLRRLLGAEKRRPVAGAVAEAGRPAMGAARPLESRGFRIAFFTVLGALGGTLAGVAATYLVHIGLDPRCAGESCIAPYAQGLMTIGALAGAIAGARRGAGGRS